MGHSAVQLTWNPVEDHERPVQNYRVYYGLTFDALDLTVDTEGSTPTWELRGLANDSQYFVAVKAIDSQGLESEEMSVVIAVTPVVPDPCAEVECGENGQCTDGACVCNEGFEGEQCDALTTLVPGGTMVQAIPMDSAVMLSWPAFAGVRGYYYKIFMGFAPGQYNDYVITPDNRTSMTVSDLINNFPYYFAISALDINGNPISAMSQEIIAIPTGTAFHPAPPVAVAPTQPGGQDLGIYRDQLGQVPQTEETGPEAIWVILSSLIFAYFLYHHKRKVILKAQN